MDVSVSQKDPEILFRLQLLFGGAVSKLYPHSIRRWTLSGARAAAFLRLVYSQLSERRQTQADAALASHAKVKVYKQRMTFKRGDIVEWVYDDDENFSMKGAIGIVYATPADTFMDSDMIRINWIVLPSGTQEVSSKNGGWLQAHFRVLTHADAV